MARVEVEALVDLHVQLPQSVCRTFKAWCAQRGLTQREAVQEALERMVAGERGEWSAKRNRE